MTKIMPCNRVGLHYNGFLNMLDSSNFVFKPESPIKILKNFYFAIYCGSWVNTDYHGFSHKANKKRPGKITGLFYMLITKLMLFERFNTVNKLLPIIGIYRTPYIAVRLP
jgi:hypothetical protein